MTIEKDYQAVVNSPLGRIGITTIQGKLSDLDFLGVEIAIKKPVDPLLAEIAGQLAAYFNESNFAFDLPLDVQGTDFQKKVWQQLQEIKSGSTLTYGELANRINSGARAVGNGCRRNPIPIVVPCHRVVAARGIGGYAGTTKGPVHDRKRWLLAHEGLYMPNKS